ncbi:hypothetical protein L7F22_069218 [Adiantum nelumboides]|nr:hypothetical protein [Adiantum nelumboides]
MMNEMNMPLTYWAEAVHIVVHIMNQTPIAAIHEISPYEGIKLAVSYMKVFGCVCYVLVPNEARKKMEPKVVKCIFLGYLIEKKGYKCYDPMTRQVYVNRDVKFCEYEPWYKLKPVTIEDEYEEQENVRHVVSRPHMAEESTGSVNQWSGHLQDKNKHAEKYVPPYARVKEKSAPQLRRSKRVRYLVDRLTYNGYMHTHYAYMVSRVQHKEPTCFQEAIGKSKWESAMDEEMDALVKNDTWDLVHLPGGMKAMGSKWVYKVKCKSNGSVERYKARLVAKGYAQTKGLDYDETMANVQHWCRSCHNCQVNGNKRLLYGPRQAVIANGPFEKWGIDAMGPLPRTANGKLYILVAIDYMTRFGTPLEIVSDNGPGFRRGLLTEVDEQNNDEAWIDRLLNLVELEWKREAAYHCYEKKALQLKDKLNEGIKDKQIKEKSLVLRYNNALDNRFDAKFERRWEGPFIVKKAFTGGYYQLMDLNGKEHPRKVNGYRLKPYLSRILPAVFETKQVSKKTKKPTIEQHGSLEESLEVASLVARPGPPQHECL